MLFAQQRGFGGPGGPGGAGAGPPPEFWIFFICAIAVLLAIGLTIQIFYLMTLSRALKQCSPGNRRMEPGLVWLNLIPCFNIVWTFITVIRLADSLQDEFYDRRLRDDGDFGRNMGITYNVLNLLGAIPYIGALFSIAGLVCFILYWVKIAGYNRQLFEDSEDRYNSYDEREIRDDDRDRRYRDDEDYDRDRFDR